MPPGAVIGLWLILWLGLSSVAAAEASREPAPLLSPRQLSGADLTILDIRPRTEFIAGHIPGALSAPYNDFGWRTSRYRRPAVLPRPETLAARLGRLGLIRPMKTVVVAGDIGLGALVYWTLKSLGHPHLYLLDGGFQAWKAAGLPLRTGAPAPRAAADYRPEPDGSIVADEEFVVDLYDNARVAIDCRSEIYWGGEKGGPAQSDPGTIKEALNLDSRRLLTSSGRFRPEGELRRLFTRKWVIDDRTAFFGYDGRHAAICWFALHQIIGNKRARLYDGGIADWELNGHDIWNLQDGMGAR